MPSLQTTVPKLPGLQITSGKSSFNAPVKAQFYGSLKFRGFHSACKQASTSAPPFARASRTILVRTCPSVTTETSFLRSFRTCLGGGFPPSPSNDRQQVASFVTNLCDQCTTPVRATTSFRCCFATDYSRLLLGGMTPPGPRYCTASKLALLVVQSVPSELLFP